MLLIQVTNDPANRRSNEKFVFLSSKDCDLTSLDACRALFETVKPTHVIHVRVFLYVCGNFIVQLFSWQLELEACLTICRITWSFS